VAQDSGSTGGSRLSDTHTIRSVISACSNSNWLSVSPGYSNKKNR
jgi:hypothetical protein